MKIKYFPVCIFLAIAAIGYLFFNTLSHKHSKDLSVYIGIKDQNGWTDDVNLFRVPFKWESGTWVAMPNLLSTPNAENKRELALSKEYPQILTFSPSVIATKIKNHSCSE